MGRVEPSETPAPVESPPEPVEAASAPAPGPDGVSDGDRERGEDGRLLSREAASYRRQLRETQSERDGLRDRLDGLQRSEVERLASGAGLAVPGDVWLHNPSLDALRDEAGAIDAEAVSGLVDALVKDRPGLKAPVNGDIGIGRGAAARPRQPPAVGLSALLKR